MAKKKLSNRKARGRPKIKITAAMLRKAEGFAADGLAKQQIAQCLGIGLSTLMEKQKEFPEFLEALKKGKAKGLATVTNALFQSARNGNVTAMIFFLKNRDAERWSDRRVYENIDRSEFPELSRITPKRTREIAENVLKVLEAREKMEGVIEQKFAFVVNGESRS